MLRHSRLKAGAAKLHKFGLRIAEAMNKHRTKCQFVKDMMTRETLHTCATVCRKAIRGNLPTLRRRRVSGGPTKKVAAFPAKDCHGAKFLEKVEALKKKKVLVVLENPLEKSIGNSLRLRIKRSLPYSFKVGGREVLASNRDVRDIIDKGLSLRIIEAFPADVGDEQM